MEVLDLGKRRFKEVWELQKRLLEERIANKIEDTLILVEHYPVITVGRHRDWNNLLVPEEFLRKRGFELYKIERGGDITYHGPGQLVGYPIFKLKGGLAGVRKFVEKIEDAIILALKEFGIEAHKREKLIGVWVGNEKIAAIGVAFKRWVSYHGFALNVNTDLENFNYIIPCGLKHHGVTSMKKILGGEVPLPRVKEKIVKAFKLTFYGVTD